MAYKNTDLRIKSFPLPEEYNDMLQELAASKGISQTKMLTQIVIEAIEKTYATYQSFTVGLVDYPDNEED